MVKTTGKIGDNFKAENFPFYVPKENMGILNAMTDAADRDAYADYSKYGNAYIHKKK